MDRLFRRRDVEAIVGLSRSSIYAAMKAGTFPVPVKLGCRTVAWRESEIDEWVNSRPKARYI
jgi:prophage regulatory protein